MRPALPLALLVLAGCFKSGVAAVSDTTAGHAAATATADPALDDAKLLGREIFEVMDKVMAYKSAHFSNLPSDLPTVGVDSLTRITVRRYTKAGAVPTVTATFRRPEGHGVLSCSGTNKVIEDSMLNGGPFEVTCQLPSGESKAFTVGG